LFRTLFGLVSEFWFEDELQIYLIGLKSYTTNTWPFYGPDVVYTNTQISGALQGLLVSIPLYLFPQPESPTIFLNILSFLSLSFFAYYVTKRFQSIPKWFVWIWVMTLTWTMNYGTRVVNPSYILIFSIPFFVSILELLPIYKNIISKKLTYFCLGLTPFLIMQLHLSFVLLFPFIGLVFFFEFKNKITTIRHKLIFLGLFLLGALIGISTVIPTWIMGSAAKSVDSNIVFNIDNIKNLGIIIARYFCFASQEIPYILGGSNQNRMDVINSNFWMAPVTYYLLIFGFALIGLFLIGFFIDRKNKEFTKIKYLNLFALGITFASFFFSIKGPSSHTFCILLPLPIIYSFYCFQYLWNKSKYWKYPFYLAIICCFFFYTGLGIYNYTNKSLYKDRARIEESIKKKDYKILGTRRTDEWGYGY
jgi:hypothetical protein